MTDAKTKQQALVTALRALADTIEQHDLRIKDWATVRMADREIGVSESDFVAMFRGQILCGKRNGNWINMKAEYAGLVFSTSLYKPTPNIVSDETICI